MARIKCGFDDGPRGSGSDLLLGLGPTLIVDIGFDPNFNPQNLRQVPTPGIRNVNALVDTGATECCIDSMVATNLGLPIIDRRMIGGVGGVQLVNMHLAQIRVNGLNVTMYGAFAAVHLQAGGQIHVALIGRSFLRNFTMTYEGRTGTVEIHNE